MLDGVRWTVSGLKEVLPMVLLAFKGSAIAKSCGQRIKAKVIFVYRSVDTNDTNKLKGNRQKLHEHLREAAEEVSHMGGGTLSSAREAREMLEIVFTDFQVDDDEKESDVKCLGNLKKGGMPPADTPEWAYGEWVVEVREYIHARVMHDITGFKASSFAEWGERLTLVWDCICSADFELSFKSKIEYNAYLELKASLQPPQRAVHEKYTEIFNCLEKKLRENMISEEESSKSLHSVLEAEVAVVVANQTGEVDRILDMNKSFAKWRSQELENWKRFCVNTQDWYQRRIADMESGVLRFDKHIAVYQQQCKSIILDKFESGEWGREQSRDVWRKKFELVFKRILEDAERKHPPISNDVHMKVMARYDSPDLAKVIDFSARKHKSNGLTGWVKRHILGQGEQLQDEPIYSELQLIIDRQLRDARQYSDIIVGNVINMTKQKLDRAIPELSREEKGAAHIWVKDALTNRMKEIQSKWDEDHNVVGKLKSLKTRDNLYDFFAGRANGLEAAAMLVRELQHCLEDELEEVHGTAVVRAVAAKLETQNLVRGWRIMRALLDYHLLGLQESGNTEKLLRYVTDGGLHFATLRDAIVGQAIEKELVQQEWDDLLKKVQGCLEGQTSVKNPSVREFVAALARKLANAVDVNLAGRVKSSIQQVKMYEGRVLDSDFYEKKLPELYRSLQRKVMPELEKRRSALIRRVLTEEMQALPDENCRPRCAATCPICGSTCFLARGHVDPRHDCVHQPAGLSGRVSHDTHELIANTCLQMEGCHMSFPDGSKIPFSDFEKHYTSWRQPSSDEPIAIQVRESIFFNFQESLVRFFNKTSSKESRVCKPCPPDRMPIGYYRNPNTFHAAILRIMHPKFEDDHASNCLIQPCPPDRMPIGYNHNPDTLRAALYNKLRPKFEDDHAWNRLIQLLDAL